MDPARTSARPFFERRSAATRSELLRREHYLALGSNLEPEFHIPACLRLLQRTACLDAVSGIWETAPIGPVRQPNFHNLVLRLVSPLSPLQLLDCCQRIERTLGRIPRQRWGPREIDIDLLFSVPGVQVQHPRLRLPHSQMRLRAFVLRPLSELAESLTRRQQADIEAALAATQHQIVWRLGTATEVYSGAEG